MKTIDLFVRIPHGIHLRVASDIVSRIKGYKAQVLISKEGGPPVKADSILELMLLAVTENTNIRVTAEGQDEVKVIRTIEEYFIDGAGI